MSQSYKVELVPVNKIYPDPNQPRKIWSKESIQGLVDSIKEHGIIKNIEVTPEYQIITGENRWRAAKMAGLTEIPCRIMDIKDGSTFARQIHENVHHIPMNPWDTAKAVEKLMLAEKLSGIQAAGRFGKSRDWIQDHLRLLRAPQSVQKMVQIGEIATSYLKSFDPLIRSEQVGDFPNGTTERVINHIKKNGLTHLVYKPLLLAIMSNPHQLEGYLGISFAGKDVQESLDAIDAVEATTAKKMAQASKRSGYYSHDIIMRSKNLARVLLAHPKEDLGMNGKQVVPVLKDLRDLIDSWL